MRLLHRVMLLGGATLVPMTLLPGLIPSSAPVPEKRATESATAKAASAFAALPLAFVENQGQWRKECRFVARRGRLTAGLQRNGIHLQLAAGDGSQLKFVFAGASPGVRVEGEQRLGGLHNFFLGDDPEHWRKHVPAYARVRYHAIYPGVDLVVHEGDRSLQYDLELAPGADLDRFVVRCEGVESLAVGDDGKLVMKTERGEVEQTAPVAWQTRGDGSRSPVVCRFRVIDDSSYGFEVDSLDAELALTVDPQIDYATYFGGNSYDNVATVAVDSQGSIYVAGYTYSTDLDPTVTHGDTSRNSNKSVAFLAKLDPVAQNDSLVFLSMFGGEGSETTVGMSLDPSGSAAYVGGWTSSRSFPTQTLNPALRTHNGGANDGFVVALDTATGATMLYGVLLGGSGNDLVHTVTVDAQGNAHVAGVKEYDGTYQLGGAAAQVHGPLGDKDAFAIVLDAAGTNVLARALIGGAGEDWPHAIALDGGTTYLAGWTVNDPANQPGWFPTTSDALKRSPAAGGGGGGGKGKGKKSQTTSTTDLDGFVVRLDPTLATVEYSTLLGGGGGDLAFDMALAGGRVYLSGYTLSSDFPTASPAIDASIGLAGDVLRGERDAFVSVIDFTAFDPGVVAPTLAFSTYLGGDSVDSGGGIAVDVSGNLYVGGVTEWVKGKQQSLPVVGDQLKASKTFARDAFLAVFRPAGNGYNLAYCTLVGGNDLDNAADVALGPQGSVHLVFSTQSTDLFTTANAAFGSSASTIWGGYVLKIASPL